jgi:transcriptional regulator with XRE-family HTH domain
MSPRAVSAEPDPVDLHVGQKIRARRRELNLSQASIAASCKVSFQQVQKYENGANRVSAAMLVKLAHALNTNPGWFVDDAPGAPGAPKTDKLREGFRLLAITPGAVELLQDFAAIPEQAQNVVREGVSMVRHGAASATAMRSAAQ